MSGDGVHHKRKNAEMEKEETTIQSDEDLELSAKRVRRRSISQPYPAGDTVVVSSRVARSIQPTDDVVQEGFKLWKSAAFQILSTLRWGIGSCFPTVLSEEIVETAGGLAWLLECFPPGIAEISRVQPVYLSTMGPVSYWFEMASLDVALGDDSATPSWASVELLAGSLEFLGPYSIIPHHLVEVSTEDDDERYALHYSRRQTTIELESCREMKQCQRDALPYFSRSVRRIHLNVVDGHEERLVDELPVRSPLLSQVAKECRLFRLYGQPYIPQIRSYIENHTTAGQWQTVKDPDTDTFLTPEMASSVIGNIVKHVLMYDQRALFSLYVTLPDHTPQDPPSEDEIELCEYVLEEISHLHVKRVVGKCVYARILWLQTLVRLVKSIVKGSYYSDHRDMIEDARTRAARAVHIHARCGYPQNDETFPFEHISFSSDMDELVLTH